MKLLEINGKILPTEDKTNIPVKFTVPDGLEKITIDYSYSPKTLEDEEKSKELISEKLKEYLGEENNMNVLDFLPVKNLITLSLDDNEKYRGAAHRQANSQHHEIAEDFASPGFVKGKISSGEWQIVQNVHSCTCPVEYKLVVNGEEK